MTSLAAAACDLHFLEGTTRVDLFAFTTDQCVVGLTHTLLVAALEEALAAGLLFWALQDGHFFVSASLDGLTFVGNPDEVGFAQTDLLTLLLTGRTFALIAPRRRYLVPVALLNLLALAVDLHKSWYANTHLLTALLAVRVPSQALVADGLGPRILATGCNGFAFGSDFGVVRFADTHLLADVAFTVSLCLLKGRASDQFFTLSIDQCCAWLAYALLFAVVVTVS